MACCPTWVGIFFVFEMGLERWLEIVMDKGLDKGLESRPDAGWGRCGACRMNGAMAMIRSRRDGRIGRSSVR